MCFYLKPFQIKITLKRPGKRPGNTVPWYSKYVQRLELLQIRYNYLKIVRHNEGIPSLGTVLMFQVWKHSKWGRITLRP